LKTEYRLVRALQSHKLRITLCLWHQAVAIDPPNIVAKNSEEIPRPIRMKHLCNSGRSPGVSFISGFREVSESKGRFKDTDALMAITFLLIL